MSDPIQGKVAQVLNSRELVVNLGAKNGVSLGMYFDVVDPQGATIYDPDTGEKLGIIKRPKVRVKISDVQEKMAIASTYRNKKTNIGGMGMPDSHISAIARTFRPPKWITKYETFKTQGRTLADPDTENTYVKIGDTVIQVISDIDDDCLGD